MPITTRPATFDQGLPASLANAWSVKLTDGTNVPAILNGAPAGTEYGLVVRNIPSGTQTVAGSLSLNDGVTTSRKATVKDVNTNADPFNDKALSVNVRDAISLAPGQFVDIGSMPSISGFVTVKGGDKGATSTQEYITHTPQGPDHESLDVSLYFGGSIIDPRIANQGTAAALASAWPTKVTDGTNTMPTGDTAARGIFHKLTDGSLSLSLLNAAPVSDTGQVAVPVRVISSLAGGGGGGTASTFTAAFPGTGTAAGYSDGTNMQGARVFDLDSGAGTQYVLGVGLRLAANGGSVEGGTSANPIRTDPTGVTTQPVSGSVSVSNFPATQPVSGTVTANQGTAAALSGGWPVKVTDGTLSVTLLNSAPGSDTGQVAVPVRIISSLAGGAGGTSSSFGSAFPATGTSAGFSDGTNMQGARVFDLDSGAGTQFVLGVGLRLSGNGGSVEGGTPSNPIRTDPTGTTTQPVSGTVTANQGTAAALSGGWPVKITDGTNTMPTGDVVARAIFHKLTDGTNTATVTASNALKVDGSAITQPISAASLPLPTGAAQDSTLSTLSGKFTDDAAATAAASESATTRLSTSGTLRLLDTSLVAGSQLVVAKGDQTTGLWVNVKNASLAVTGTFWQATQPVSGTFWQATQPVSGTFWQATQPISAASLPLPTGAAQDSTLSTLSGKFTDDAAATAAASESATTRLSVFSTLRLLDTSLGAGSQLVTAKGDQTTGLWVNVKNPSLAVTGTFWQATQPVSGTVTANQGTAAALSGGWPVKVTDGTNTMPTMDAIARPGFFKITDGTRTVPTEAGSSALFVTLWQGSTQLGINTLNVGTFGGAAQVFAARYRTALPTLTSDCPNPFQLDVNGRLIVTGESGMTALKVDGSGVTQPVSGTVTVKQQTPSTAGMLSAAVNVSASGDNVLVAGVAAQTIRVMKLFLVFSAGANATFKDGAGTSLTGAMAMLANGSLVLDLDGEPWFITSTANAFILNLSGAVQVSGRIYYTQS